MSLFLGRKTNLLRILIGAACAAFCSPAPVLAQYVYVPVQIRTAYGFNGVPLTGAGQTIAIVDAYNNPTIKSDLAMFDSNFGISAPPSFSIVNQTGGSTLPTATDSGWALESDLDVEWAHAIAPEANILLVETDDYHGANMQTGVRTAAAAPGTCVVSMSWGGNELDGETGNDTNYVTPSGHQGVSFVASTGDKGYVQYPSVAPTVLAVGGTSLYLNGSGGYGSETVWNNSDGSGGGGVSTQESKPGYQSKAQQTGKRTVPDVAYDAASNTDFATIVSGQLLNVYGTSAGAPQWAALIALANQGRAINGFKSLDSSDLANGLLPDLYDLYNTPKYSQAFHDVTTGTNSTGQAAGPGYDTATGLGTPKADFLIPYLADLNRPPAPYNQDIRNNTGAAQRSLTVVLAGDQTANLGNSWWNHQFGGGAPTIRVIDGNTYLTFSGPNAVAPGAKGHVGYTLMGGTTVPHGNGSPDVIDTFWGTPDSNTVYHAPAVTVDVNMSTPSIGPYQYIAVYTETTRNGTETHAWQEIAIGADDRPCIDLTNAESDSLTVDVARFLGSDTPISLDDLNYDSLPPTDPDFLAIPGIGDGSIIGPGDQLQSAPIPEPTSLGLVGIGAIGLLARRRRVA
jgi:hypothetical protein